MGRGLVLLARADSTSEAWGREIATEFLWRSSCTARRLFCSSRTTRFS